MRLIIAMLSVLGLAIDAALVQSNSQCIQPSVRDELAERVQIDQELRLKPEAAQPTHAKHRELWVKIHGIDERNTKWLRGIVNKYGWPGKALVGERGAHNAWLLVQHADRDRKFQRRCLQLMVDQPKDEVSRVDIAYLTDRLLVADGKPQRFGTQAKIVDGKAEISDTEDPKNLDKRRLSHGLIPMKEYVRALDSLVQGEDTVGGG